MHSRFLTLINKAHKIQIRNSKNNFCLFIGTEQSVFGSCRGFPRDCICSTTCRKLSYGATDAAITLGWNKTSGIFWGCLSPKISKHQQYDGITYSHAKKQIHSTPAISNFSDQSKRRLPFLEPVHSWKW